MAVIEILQLRVKDGLPPNDQSILSSLRLVRTALKSRVINTKSRFFRCIEDPTLIYLFGIWPSIEAHLAFGSSLERSEVLKPQDKVLDFNWMLHIPISSMSDLPLDAPVICVARLHVMAGEHVTAFKHILENHRSKVEEATRPYKVLSEWRCDSEEGRQEVIMVTGWESPEAHRAFTATAREDSDYASARDHYEGMDVKHVRDMET